MANSWNNVKLLEKCIKVGMNGSCNNLFFLIVTSETASGTGIRSGSDFVCAGID